MEGVKHAGRGFLMGLADLVPGISGGTVALILGIHPRLVRAVAAFDAWLPRSLFRTLRGDPEGREALRHLDLRFLLPLLGGLLLAILLGARAVSALLEFQPQVAMAFFLGLLLASLSLPWRRITHHGPSAWAGLAAGTVAAAAVTLIPGAEIPIVWWGILIAGAIGLTAMIMPGISGAGLLILLGIYPVVLAAVADLRWGVLIPFAIGGAVGLIVASRALRWLFAHRADPTWAVLTGLLAGSLVRVWPWRSEPGFAEGLPALPMDLATVPLVLATVALGVMLVKVVDRWAGPTEDR